jgi:hypothetical protein
MLTMEGVVRLVSTKGLTDATCRTKDVKDNS